jgi:hypothetical protein
MYNIDINDAGGRYLAETNANYRLVELYREQCRNVETEDVHPAILEAHEKRVNRGRDAQQEAKMIAHRDYCVAMTDYCGSF